MSEEPIAWDERYRSGDTPWDFGGTPSDLRAFLSEKGPIGRVLVPGCGSGHDGRALLDAGNDVVAIDLSETAVQLARKRIGDDRAQAIFQADFFAADLGKNAFDAIYERTFLCALDPALRDRYLERIRELLKPGGWLFGYFLYGHEPDPPPYPMDPARETTAFSEYFDRKTSIPSRDPLPIFDGMERWQIWEKRR